jgi:two-component system chemotaxis response regulator CheY
MPGAVLIVDDSATMRKIIMRTIRTAGIMFQVTHEASNGKEALAKLQEGPVDLVLCDINMPEMNGMEFVKNARQLPNCKDTMTIMVSTESSPELIEQVKALGATAYISKPFTPERFKEVLAPLLN